MESSYDIDTNVKDNDIDEENDIVVSYENMIVVPSESSTIGTTRLDTLMETNTSTNMITFDDTDGHSYKHTSDEAHGTDDNNEGYEDNNIGINVPSSNSAEYFFSIAANVIGQFAVTNNDVLQGGNVPRQGVLLPTTIRQRQTKKPSEISMYQVDRESDDENDTDIDIDTNLYNNNKDGEEVENFLNEKNDQEILLTDDIDDVDNADIDDVDQDAEGVVPHTEVQSIKDNSASQVNLSVKIPISDENNQQSASTEDDIANNQFTDISDEQHDDNNDLTTIQVQTSTKSTSPRVQHKRDNTNTSIASSSLYADDERDEQGIVAASDYEWTEDEDNDLSEPIAKKDSNVTTHVPDKQKTYCIDEFISTRNKSPGHDGLGNLNNDQQVELLNENEAIYSDVYKGYQHDRKGTLENTKTEGEFNVFSIPESIFEDDRQQSVLSSSDNDGDVEGASDDNDDSSASSTTVVTTNAKSETLSRRQESIGTMNSNNESNTLLVDDTVNVATSTKPETDNLDESWEMVDASFELNVSVLAEEVNIPDTRLNNGDDIKVNDATATSTNLPQYHSTTVSLQSDFDNSHLERADIDDRLLSNDIPSKRQTADLMTMPPISLPPPTSSALAVLGGTSKTFVFLSDEQAVPQQLNKLQENSARQRHEFQTRVHSLECKIASMTAKLAVESMETDMEIKAIKDDIIYRPIEQAHQRLSLDQTRSCIGSSRRINLEKEMSSLDAQMTHSVFVKFHDAKKKAFDTLRDEIEQDAKIDLHIESIHAAKREAVLVRQFEELVGSMTRRYQEERACRLASFQIIQEDIEKTKDGVDLKRKYEDLLDQIQQLRERIASEKVVREEMDLQILEQIKVRHSLMQKSILEAFSDPHA